MKKLEDERYLVGYGRPPKEHQFQPGQSGNPLGRPKYSRSFKSDLRDELNQLIAIQDGEDTVSVTKQRAIVITLLRLAIAGDPRAIATIVTSCNHAFGDDHDPDEESPEDRAIMDAIAPAPKKNGAQSNKALADDKKADK